MRFLKKASLVILVLLIIAAVALYLMPTQYKVERSMVIEAKPEAIHAIVDDFRTWEQWSAWNTELDPTIKRTFSGPEKGVGSKMSWQGDKVGIGYIAWTASDPTQGVRYDLDFNDGEMKSTGAIAYEPLGTGTRVTWSNEGDVKDSIVGRALRPFFDKMMGPDFEKGLSRLKTLAESKK